MAALERNKKINIEARGKKHNARELRPKSTAQRACPYDKFFPQDFHVINLPKLF